MDALSIRIQDDGSDVSVWLGLPDENPISDRYGFVIGTGKTRQLALTDAVAALEDATERLQGRGPSKVKETSHGRIETV